MSPYQEGLQWITSRPGTGSARGIAKLILSLWNEDCSFSFRECVSELDSNLSGLAQRMTAQFLSAGEDQDLAEVGHKVVELYPRLWEVSLAMTHARREKQQELRLADEEESNRLYKGKTQGKSYD